MADIDLCLDSVRPFSWVRSADAFARLYAAIGTRVHVQREDIAPGALNDILRADEFHRSLSGAFDDSGFDAAVENAHQASQSALRGRAGSPTIAFDGNAHIGSVLTCVPNLGDGVAIPNGVLTTAKRPGFAVLQRPHQGSAINAGSVR